MDFVITGGAGFIGSHIAKHLVSTGHHVTIFDDLSNGKKDNLDSIINKIEFVNGDIRNFDLLKNTLKDTDGVFHEAALASVQESFSKQQEYHDVNVNGTENVLKLGKEFGFKIVYASSSSIYGNPAKIPIEEDDPKNPINPYAQTKLDDENLAIKYAQMGVRVIGLRYFNVFGERQSRAYAGVIKKFVKKVRNGEPPIINGDGQQTRDFVYVGDVVQANVLAMNSNVDHGFFNIGTNSTITVLELANLIIDSFGLSLKPIHGPELPGDVKITKADISRAKKLLNWEPKTRIEEWLKSTITTRTNLDLITD
ncbi:NAD-dependent epimerase/dehydratase family protein [Candidatus Nitrosotenuis sp. DW1]|uniref:NAD-dependent epimerase/dehydratase family protein n=1 Tax=Candidatus Nitrosotenuis sp. DW1 TaxID=2259672 RepID=UPI0015C9AF8E|nr:NAD-dependent epimerase/dehydratase family protein [Candidatus Nitrosotenuis sp. DW1]QLH09724.1 NAD-dependent epimerase [Candidatus Nitrosotenuis sp. DW1]